MSVVGSEHLQTTLKAVWLKLTQFCFILKTKKREMIRSIPKASRVKGKQLKLLQVLQDMEKQ